MKIVKAERKETADAIKYHITLEFSHAESYNVDGGSKIVIAEAVTQALKLLAS